MAVSFDVSNRVLQAQLAQLKHELVFKKAELILKEAELAHKQAQLDAKELILTETHLTKQACKGEMLTVLNECTEVFWDTSEKVLDLTKDLQEYQNSRTKKQDEATTTTPAARPGITPQTLFSAEEDVSKKIANAKVELSKTVKVWKRAKAGLETMEIYNRKRLLENILGKEDPADHVVDSD